MDINIGDTLSDSVENIKNGHSDSTDTKNLRSEEIEKVCADSDNSLDNLKNIINSNTHKIDSNNYEDRGKRSSKKKTKKIAFDYAELLNVNEDSDWGDIDSIISTDPVSKKNEIINVSTDDENMCQKVSHKHNGSVCSEKIFKNSNIQKSHSSKKTAAIDETNLKQNKSTSNSNKIKSHSVNGFSKKIKKNVKKGKSFTEELNSGMSSGKYVNLPSPSKVKTKVKTENNQCCGHWFNHRKGFIKHLIDCSLGTMSMLHVEKLIENGFHNCELCYKWLPITQIKRHVRIAHNTDNLNNNKDSDASSVNEKKVLNNINSDSSDELSSHIKKNMNKGLKPCPLSKKNVCPQEIVSNEDGKGITCNLKDDQVITIASESELPMHLQPVIHLSPKEAMQESSLKGAIQLNGCPPLDNANGNIMPNENSQQIDLLSKSDCNPQLDHDIDIQSSDTDCPSRVDIKRPSPRKTIKSKTPAVNNINSESVPPIKAKKQKLKILNTKLKPSKMKKTPSLSTKGDHGKLRRTSVEIKKSLTYGTNKAIRRRGRPSKLRLEGSSIDKLKRDQWHTKIKRKIRRVGFHSSESSESSSSDSISIKYDSDNEGSDFEDNMREKYEDIPTVELDMVTLSTANDISILLTEPCNPDFKVFASMDAIFVGDSALGDVTNQVGYVSDVNNVVFVNPSHNLFPSVDETEKKCVKQGLRNGTKKRDEENKIPVSVSVDNNDETSKESIPIISETSNELFSDAVIMNNNDELINVPASVIPNSNEKKDDRLIEDPPDILAIAAEAFKDFDKENGPSSLGDCKSKSGVMISNEKTSLSSSMLNSKVMKSVQSSVYLLPKQNGSNATLPAKSIKFVSTSVINPVAAVKTNSKSLLLQQLKVHEPSLFTPIASKNIPIELLSRPKGSRGRKSFPNLKDSKNKSLGSKQNNVIVIKTSSNNVIQNEFKPTRQKFSGNSLKDVVSLDDAIAALAKEYESDVGGQKDDSYRLSVSNTSISSGGSHRHINKALSANKTSMTGLSLPVEGVSKGESMPNIFDMDNNEVFDLVPNTSKAMTPLQVAGDSQGLVASTEINHFETLEDGVCLEDVLMDPDFLNFGNASVNKIKCNLSNEISNIVQDGSNCYTIKKKMKTVSDKGDDTSKTVSDRSTINLHSNASSSDISNNVVPVHSKKKLNNVNRNSDCKVSSSQSLEASPLSRNQSAIRQWSPSTVNDVNDQFPTIQTESLASTFSAQSSLKHTTSSSPQSSNETINGISSKLIFDNEGNNKFPSMSNDYDNQLNSCSSNNEILAVIDDNHSSRAGADSLNDKIHPSSSHPFLKCEELAQSPKKESTDLDRSVDSICEKKTGLLALPQVNNRNSSVAESTPILSLNHDAQANSSKIKRAESNKKLVSANGNDCTSSPVQSIEESPSFASEDDTASNIISTKDHAGVNINDIIKGKSVWDTPLLFSPEKSIIVPTVPDKTDISTISSNIKSGDLSEVPLSKIPDFYSPTRSFMNRKMLEQSPVELSPNTVSSILSAPGDMLLEESPRTKTTPKRTPPSSRRKRSLKNLLKTPIAARNHKSPLKTPYANFNVTDIVTSTPNFDISPDPLKRSRLRTHLSTPQKLYVKSNSSTKRNKGTLKMKISLKNLKTTYNESNLETMSNDNRVKYYSSSSSSSSDSDDSSSSSCEDSDSSSGSSSSSSNSSSDSDNSSDSSSESNMSSDKEDTPKKLVLQNFQSSRKNRTGSDHLKRSYSKRVPKLVKSLSSNITAVSNVRSISKIEPQVSSNSSTHLVLPRKQTPVISPIKFMTDIASPSYDDLELSEISNNTDLTSLKIKVRDDIGKPSYEVQNNIDSHPEYSSIKNVFTGRETGAVYSQKTKSENETPMLRLLNPKHPMLQRRPVRRSLNDRQLHSRTTALEASTKLYKQGCSPQSYVSDNSLIDQQTASKSDRVSIPLEDTSKSVVASTSSNKQQKFSSNVSLESVNNSSIDTKDIRAYFSPQSQLSQEENIPLTEKYENRSRLTISKEILSECHTDAGVHQASKSSITPKKRGRKPRKSPANSKPPSVGSKLKQSSLNSKTRPSPISSKLKSAPVGRKPNPRKRKRSENVDIRQYFINDLDPKMDNSRSSKRICSNIPLTQSTDSTPANIYHLYEKRLKEATVRNVLRLTETDFDFTGFSDITCTISSSRSEQLNNFVEVLQMTSWFQNKMFPLPIDQLCDWNEDKLNAILFENG